jgi:hypothetical protein
MSTASRSDESVVEVIALPRATGGVPTVSPAIVWMDVKSAFSSGVLKPLLGSEAVAPS